MTKSQTVRLKAYLLQIITHPHLTNIEKMCKAEKFIDKLNGETND